MGISTWKKFLDLSTAGEKPTCMPFFLVSFETQRLQVPLKFNGDFHTQPVVKLQTPHLLRGLQPCPLCRIPPPHPAPGHRCLPYVRVDWLALESCAVGARFCVRLLLYSTVFLSSIHVVVELVNSFFFIIEGYLLAHSSFTYSAINGHTWIVCFFPMVFFCCHKDAATIFAIFKN